MKVKIYTAATDPVSPMKDFLQATIRAGFFSKPSDLLPGNLVCCVDETVGFDVLLYAARKALQSLADEGQIVDTGRRVTCEITGDEEVVWAKAG